MHTQNEHTNIATTASSCASGFMNLDVLRKRAEKIPFGLTSFDVLSNEFRLIPDMTFTCNGTITSLLLGVDIRTVTSSRNMYPKVQIWRRNHLNSSYTRQESQEIRLNAGNFSPNGVLEYNLTFPMQFKSGDMLGIYQPHDFDSVVRLYYNENDSAPDAIRVTGELPSALTSPRQFSIERGEYILLSPIAGINYYFFL